MTTRSRGGGRATRRRTAVALLVSSRSRPQQMVVADHRRESRPRGRRPSRSAPRRCPGATTTSEAEPCAPMLRNALITPHTVPIRPMNGETLPAVARKPTWRSSRAALIVWRRGPWRAARNPGAPRSTRRPRPDPDRARAGPPAPPWPARCRDAARTPGAHRRGRRACGMRRGTPGRRARRGRTGAGEFQITAHE